MPIQGNPGLWSDLFPDHLVPEILELVASSWKNFKRPAPLDLEVPVTRRFVEDLRRNKNLLALPFTIWPESSEADPVSGKETGRIDIRFLHGYRETVYFAFECKRLRIPYESKVKPNTGEYIGSDGMMRFIEGKYAGGLNSGGMIGFVMDGNIKLAVNSIANAMEKNRDLLCLSTNTKMAPCPLVSNIQTVQETSHSLKPHTFMLYHVFLGL